MNESSTQPENSDEVLVVRAQAGDREAFGELIRRRQKKILNLCYRLIGESRTAEELAADVFAEAYRSLRRFHRKAKFETWLYRIALNLNFHYLRSQQRKRILFPEFGKASLDEENDVSTQAVSNAPNPRESLERQELTDRIRLVLSRLSEEHAHILILHDIEGLSYEEASHCLNCPIGTVMSRLARARAAFRKKWNQKTGSNE